jgi:hypothetical protein
MEQFGTARLPREEYFFSFGDRAGRYHYLQERFGDVFASSNRILDVGCDENYLKKVYGDKVFGIDIAGTPDRVVDLEKEALRSFSDGSYDLVICTEVLEHIDNLHEVFYDLIRVSSRHVLISLPNSTSTRRFWKLARTGRTPKFYGLPFEKPQDRHKWYFSYREIIDFISQASASLNLTPRAVIFHYNVRHKDERRLFHRIKQYIESHVIRLLCWRNQSQDVIVLFEKNA